MFIPCGWRSTSLTVALVCAAWCGGCARDNKLLTRADWEFLDGRSKSAINATPSDAPAPKAKTKPKTESVRRAKPSKSEDPFLAETVDDESPVTPKPRKKTALRSVRMLPMGEGLKREAPSSVREAPPMGDEPHVRVTANRPMTAQRESPPPAKAEPIAAVQINPGPQVESVDPPQAEAAKTLPPEPQGQLVSNEQPAAPPKGPPPGQTLPPEAAVAPESPVQAPVTEDVATLPEPRIEIRPTVELAGGIEQDPFHDPEAGQGLAPQDAAPLEPGETYLPNPVVTDGPRLVVPAEAPHTLAATPAAEPLFQGKAEVDLFAPAPLEAPARSKLSRTSRIGLAIGLAGLVGIGLWRLLERRRFIAAR